MTFDAVKVFNDWSSRNKIMSAWRSRFDGVREKLNWAALDETDKGCHPECALKWAVQTEEYSSQYPFDTDSEL